MGNDVSDDLKSKVRKAIESGEDGGGGTTPPEMSPSQYLAARKYRTEVAMFVRELAVLFDAGLPLHKAMGLIAKRTSSSKLGQFLTGVSNQVETGTPLWKAMSSYPGVFNRLSVTLVKAGEESGEAGKTLRLAGDAMEFGDEMERRVINVLLFPMITLLVAAAVLMLLLTVIFPSMSHSFETAEFELPAITTFIWCIGVHLQSWWFLYVLLIVAAAVAMVFFIKSRLYLLEFLKLRLPLVGEMLAMSAMARFAKAFGVLLEAGLNAPDALELSRDVVDNATIAQAIEEMKVSALQGGSMATPLANHWYIPEMTADLIAIGEESGSLPELLGHMARLFDVKVKARAERLTTILEPVMTLVASLIVMIVALAMFLPYFGMIREGIGG